MMRGTAPVLTALFAVGWLGEAMSPWATVPRRLRDFVYDALCVLLFVVIGTRNHKTDTGLSGILYVAAPFWIAMS